VRARVVLPVVSVLLWGCGGAAGTTSAEPATSAPSGSYVREVTSLDTQRGDPGIPTGRWRLEISDAQLHAVAPDSGSVTQLMSVEGDELVMGPFADTEESRFCEEDVAEGARYRWREDGGTLVLTLQGEDPCTDRDAILPGTWTAAP